MLDNGIALDATRPDSPQAPAAPDAVGRAAGAAQTAIAIVCNSLPPYRLHVHRRIVDELPAVRLWTVFTHEEDGRWPLIAPPEIGPVSFGKGESCWDQHKLRYAAREWRRGGRIIRWLDRQSIAAVVLLGYNDFGRLRILRWCRRSQVPCFIWGDSNIKDDTARGISAYLKRLLLPRVLRYATGILPCGRLGQDYFARYGVRRERMFLFPVEPDYALFGSTTADQVDAARHQFGLAPERRRMVYSGRLSQNKRVDLLIDAFAMVASERPDWDLLILGDQGERPQLEARVPARIRPRVLWPGHLSDPATLAAVYRASDLLVLPSDQEPWALVINEAAAAGMAIVSSDVPGASAELVRDGVNGRVFLAGNAAALADCLRDVTRADRIDAMKAASGEILAEWRRRGDPIQGLRRALEFCGVLQT